MQREPLNRRAVSAGWIALAAIGLIATGLVLPDNARAADEQTLRDTRGVIERQLDAFAHDDGSAAYGLASPAIQEIFPNESVFMDMVRRGFQPVYRARSHSFGEVRDTDGGLEQLVRVQDEQGQEWDALYSLERGPDGAWRISGCRLIKSPDRSA